MADDYGQLIARGVRSSNDDDLPRESSQEQASMLFMVIEGFAANDMVPVYQRGHTEGRMLPDGLDYVDSWVEPNFARCFQLTRYHDLPVFQEWALNWRGSCATFEIVPTSREVSHLDAAIFGPVPHRHTADFLNIVIGHR